MLGITPYRDDMISLLWTRSTNLNYSEQQIQMFNQMRLYMKIISASDSIDDTTSTLKINIIRCKKTLPSTYGFPNIKAFPSTWITLWDSIIYSIILPRVQSVPLGRRISHSHLDTSPIYEDLHKTNCEHNVSLQKKDIEITFPAFCNAVNAIQEKIRLSPKWKKNIFGALRGSHLSPRLI